MLKRENQNRLAAEIRYSDKTFLESEKLKDISVLHISPKHINLEEEKSIYLRSRSLFKNSPVYSYNNIGETFENELISFLLFLKTVLERINKVSHVHVYYFSKISFLFQILPLLILTRFYSKKFILEFSDFENYYEFEEAGFFIRKILKYIDTIIVPSENQARSLRKKQIRAVCLSHNIDTNLIQSKVIDQVQPKILVNAHLEDIFNFSCLLKVYQIVKQKYPRTELIIAGDGTARESYEKQIQNAKIFGVSFVSNQQDDLFEEIDLFINCYHVEYFSLELLQAMASGIPVISSPVGMIDKLIMRKNILMYQFNDSSTLTDNILELIEQPNLVRELSENGRLFACNYGSESESLLNFYANL